MTVQIAPCAALHHRSNYWGLEFLVCPFDVFGFLAQSIKPKPYARGLGALFAGVEHKVLRGCGSFPKQGDPKIDPKLP